MDDISRANRPDDKNHHHHHHRLFGSLILLSIISIMWKTKRKKKKFFNLIPSIYGEKKFDWLIEYTKKNGTCFILLLTLLLLLMIYRSCEFKQFSYDDDDRLRKEIILSNKKNCQHHNHHHWKLIPFPFILVYCVHACKQTKQVKCKQIYHSIDQSNNR